jgi:phenylacetic acid degradation operon negative regulatory protein
MLDPPAARAPDLLPTLLGDYWFHSRAFIPSAALVRLLAEFGVGADATRAVLSRQSRAGRLERRRDGRRTAYRLAPDLADAAAALGGRLMRFGDGPIGWDGRWTCVAFSVPEPDARLRALLRRRLRALGLGALFDGLWITPHAPLTGIAACLGELGIAGAAVLRATSVPVPDGADLVDVWDLPALRARYAGLEAALDRVDARRDAGPVDPTEALVGRTELMLRWRALAMTDPRLPDELLPPSWPRQAARARFVAAYDALGPPAEARVRELAGDGEPRHHRVEDIARLRVPG